MIEFSTVLVLDQAAEQVAKATVHASAQGVYELSLDGRPVTDSVLNPGWTAYEWRLQYQSFDVTPLLRAGPAQVLLSARVGNGWWRGDYGFEGLAANYGEEIGLLAVLEIEYADGARQVLRTSPQWRAGTCDVVANSFYQGQTIDARLRDRRQPVLPVRVAGFDASQIGRAHV